MEIQNSTLLHRVRKGFKNFCHQMLHNTSNLHLVGRDHRHLENEYRRTLTAPDLAVGEIGQLLEADDLFIEALQRYRGQLLVRACIVGDEVRANIYPVMRVPGGLLSPLYSEDWRRDSIVQYVVDSDGENIRMRCLYNANGTQPDLSYDYFEPCMTYVRDLTEAENAHISRMARPNWSQAA